MVNIVTATVSSHVQWLCHAWQILLYRRHLQHLALTVFLPPLTDPLKPMERVDDTYVPFRAEHEVSFFKKIFYVE